jgi:hypothetical protein
MDGFRKELSIVCCPLSIAYSLCKSDNEMCLIGKLAGTGFEPVISRLWAWRDATSPPRYKLNSLARYCVKVCAAPAAYIRVRLSPLLNLSLYRIQIIKFLVLLKCRRWDLNPHDLAIKGF